MMEAAALCTGNPEPAAEKQQRGSTGRNLA